jgi:hypothetical protein
MDKVRTKTMGAHVDGRGGAAVGKMVGGGSMFVAVQSKSARSTR